MTSTSVGRTAKQQCLTSFFKPITKKESAPRSELTKPPMALRQRLSLISAKSKKLCDAYYKRIPATVAEYPKPDAVVTDSMLGTYARKMRAQGDSSAFIKNYLPWWFWQSREGPPSYYKGSYTKFDCASVCRVCDNYNWRADGCVEKNGICTECLRLQTTQVIHRNLYLLKIHELTLAKQAERRRQLTRINVLSTADLMTQKLTLPLLSD